MATRFQGWRKLLGKSAPDAVDFRNQPFVCGVIGRFDEGCLERLRDHAPATLHEVHRSETAVLFASQDPERWQTDTDHGFLWNSLAGDERPTSWQSVAEHRMAAGLRIGADGAMLHTDALGMQDVFTRRIGDALYFATRIDPLVRLDDAPLHTDWTAWASIFAVRSPVSDRTPFEEIRRVPAATAWIADGQGIRTTGFEPTWLSAEPDGTVKAEDAMETVARCVPTADLAITLSGGWDSRLLAILARRHSDRTSAWTTSGDDGRDIDIDFAGPVAAALGLEHHTIVPGPDAWVNGLATVRRRVEFQTSLHVWIMPMARALHGRDECFLDGLAGDVLFKSLFVREELAVASDPADRHRLLWNSLAQGRLKDPGRLAPGIAADFEARSRESLVESTNRFDGHPSAAMLGVLHTRTTRAIGLSPLRLMAPELQVSVPFVHPDVIGAALRVPTVDKLGGEFYRAMLSAADPRVATLPSTNDPGSKGKRGAQRQTTPTALHAMARSIRSSETVVRLLGPEFRRALGDADDLGRIGATMFGHRILNWASLFAEWRTAYADVLADDDPT